MIKSTTPIQLVISTLAYATFAAEFQPYTIEGDWKITKWGTKNFSNLENCRLDSKGGLWYTVMNGGLNHLYQDSLFDTQTDGLAQGQDHLANGLYIDEKDSIFVNLRSDLVKGFPGNWTSETYSTSLDGISKNNGNLIVSQEAGGVFQREAGKDWEKIPFYWKPYAKDFNFINDTLSLYFNEFYPVIINGKDTLYFYVNNDGDMAQINDSLILLTFGGNLEIGVINLRNITQTNTLLTNKDLPSLFNFPELKVDSFVYEGEGSEIKDMARIAKDEKGNIWVAGQTYFARLNLENGKWDSWKGINSDSTKIKDIRIRDGKLVICGDGTFFEYLGDLHLSSSETSSSSSESTQALLPIPQSPFQFSEGILRGIPQEGGTLTLRLFNNLGQLIEQSNLTLQKGHEFNHQLTIPNQGVWHLLLELNEKPLGQHFIIQK